MTRDDLPERVAVLEAHNKSLDETQGEILAELKALRAEFTRYKGFAGGIAFAVSCLVTFVLILKGWVIGK